MAPYDNKNTILAEFDQFAELEARIVKAAALHITEPQKKTLLSLGGALVRCAKIGDIDANVLTDRKIEELIGQSAQLDAESRSLAESKLAFKEQWRSRHRFKDTIAVAQMRADQINEIIAGNGEKAALMCHEFFNLMKEAMR